MLLTIVPPVAAAAPGGDPAVDQYVESVPSTEGDRAPNTEPRSGGGGGLSPDARRQVERQGGEDAEALDAIAGSPALGAPSQPAANGAGKGSGGSSEDEGGSGKDAQGSDAGSSDARSAEADDGPSAISAVTSAVVGGDGSSGGLLLAGLVLLSAAMAGTALARRRSQAR